MWRETIAAFLGLCLSVAIAGCAQPGAVRIDREAIRAEVKAAVLSPEITSAISNHVSASVGTVKMELIRDVSARVETRIARTTSQPVSNTITSGEKGVSVGVGNVEGGTLIGIVSIVAAVGGTLFALLAALWLLLKSGKLGLAATRAVKCRLHPFKAAGLRAK